MFGGKSTAFLFKICRRLQILLHIFCHSVWIWSVIQYYLRKFHCSFISIDAQKTWANCYWFIRATTPITSNHTESSRYKRERFALFSECDFLKVVVWMNPQIKQTLFIHLAHACAYVLLFNVSEWREFSIPTAKVVLFFKMYKCFRKKMRLRGKNIWRIGVVDRWCPCYLSYI